MIDEEWLSTLVFELKDVGHVHSLVGVGGLLVVFAVTTPTGEEKVVKLRKELFYLPCYLREPPIWLSCSEPYDLERLSRKLGQAVGDPVFHSCVESYKNLYAALVDSLVSDDDLLIERLVRMSNEVEWAFIYQMPPVVDRLTEISEDSSLAGQRARNALSVMTELGEAAISLVPDAVFDNPILTWSGAVLSGYLSSGEFRPAAQALRRRLKESPDSMAPIFIAQTGIFVGALQDVLGIDIRKLSSFLDAFNDTKTT
jgi:hypothetical protein